MYKENITILLCLFGLCLGIYDTRGLFRFSFFKAVYIIGACSSI